MRNIVYITTMVTQLETNNSFLLVLFFYWICFYYWSDVIFTQWTIFYFFWYTSQWTIWYKV